MSIAVVGVSGAISLMGLRCMVRWYDGPRLGTERCLLLSD
jgi:hypothetical protein